MHDLGDGCGGEHGHNPSEHVVSQSGTQVAGVASAPAGLAFRGGAPQGHGHAAAGHPQRHGLPINVASRRVFHRWPGNDPGDEVFRCGMLVDFALTEWMNRHVTDVRSIVVDATAGRIDHEEAAIPTAEFHQATYMVQELGHVVDTINHQQVAGGLPDECGRLLVGERIGVGVIKVDEDPASSICQVAGDNAFAHLWGAVECHHREMREQVLDFLGGETWFYWHNPQGTRVIHH